CSVATCAIQRGQGFRRAKADVRAAGASAARPHPRSRPHGAPRRRGRGTRERAAVAGDAAPSPAGRLAGWRAPARLAAAAVAGASLLAVECQPSRIEKRIETGYLDTWTKSLDEALKIIQAACAKKEPVSVGLLGNAAEIFPELVRRGVRPDIVTDQTSAHDPLNGYLPAGWTLDEAEERRRTDPEGVVRAAKESMAVHVRAMLDFYRSGVPTLDYGNNIRQFAKEMGVADAFDF